LLLRWKDVDTLKKALFAGLWLLPVLAWPALAASTDSMKTSGTGSRAPAVHRIPVYSEGLFGDGYERITSRTDPPMPLSMRGTCTECHVYRHDYDTISKGWHFNATDPNVPAGRPGHPWIYVDAATGTQIPLSYRGWPGTFRPDQVGMSPFRFTQLFGRQMPGGGPGEVETEVENEIARQMIAGSLEINCLACHDRDPALDMAEWADNISRQNFRWAATASSAVGAVTGSARRMPDTFDPGMPDMITDPDLLSHVPTVTYYQGAFDHRDQVFFDVGGRVLADRCYACHSGTNVDLHGTHRWKADEDIHMTAGMTCTDCHRHGLDHDTIRGYEGEASANPLAAATTCKGCHLGEDTTPPTAGRLGRRSRRTRVSPASTSSALRVPPVMQAPGRAIGRTGPRLRLPMRWVRTMPSTNPMPCPIYSIRSSPRRASRLSIPTGPRCGVPGSRRTR
jgi:hypothetical protein